MPSTLSTQDLINFEDEIGELWDSGQIKAPVHFSDGNEQELIDIFQNYNIGKEDWVCGTWRMHYECLLKGVPPEKLKQAILERHSISLCFSEYRVISSAIVGGICPIALGLAKGLRLKQEKSRWEVGNVFCFVGDMSSETGIFHECHKYSLNFDLPIYWVISDNNKSVCTNTRETWGLDNGLTHQSKGKIIYYKYKSRFPHAGRKKRVIF